MLSRELHDVSDPEITSETKVASNRGFQGGQLEERAPAHLSYSGLLLVNLGCLSLGCNCGYVVELCVVLSQAIG